MSAVIDPDVENAPYVVRHDVLCVIQLERARLLDDMIAELMAMRARTDVEPQHPRGRKSPADGAITQVVEDTLRDELHPQVRKLVDKHDSSSDLPNKQSFIDDLQAEVISEIVKG